MPRVGNSCKQKSAGGLIYSINQSCPAFQFLIRTLTTYKKTVGFRELCSEHQHRRDQNRSMLPHTTIQTDQSQDVKRIWPWTRAFSLSAELRWTLTMSPQRQFYFQCFQPPGVSGTIHRPGVGGGGGRMKAEWTRKGKWRSEWALAFPLLIGFWISCKHLLVICFSPCSLSHYIGPWSLFNKLCFLCGDQSGSWDGLCVELTAQVKPEPHETLS